ncbi:MAG TPA: hypothetical protein VMU99_00115 [Acidimicrobiales bacterium]|nr:hypothetical protein [Acidimicrobiales bacterium]
MMFAEATGESVHQLGDLLSEPALCHVVNNARVVLAGFEGVEKDARRDAVHFRGYRREIHSGVLHQLFQALNLASAFTNDRGARASEVA